VGGVVAGGIQRTLRDEFLHDSRAVAVALGFDAEAV
jgi:hypothetical protein